MAYVWQVKSAKIRERVELERDLATQRARLAEAQSTLKETGQAKAAYRAETTRSLSDRQAQAASKRSQLQSDASKASQRERLTQLTAPVAGVIQQLAIYSVGGVVTADAVTARKMNQHDHDTSRDRSR